MEFTINVHITGVDKLAGALLALAGKQEAAPAAADHTAAGAAAAPASAGAAPAIAPATAPSNPVPVAAPAPFTIEQLQKAAGGLVDAGKQGELMGLLAKYQVQALTLLAPEQYGAFATDLRGLGAKI